MVYNRLVKIKADGLMSPESFLKVCTVYFTFGMIDEAQYNELLDIVVPEPEVVGN